MPAVVTISGEPVPEGASAIYECLIEDFVKKFIPASALLSCTLSIADTLTGRIVNGISSVSILNTGRGTINEQGNLLITLLPSDTLIGIFGVTKIQRSLVVDWTWMFEGNLSTGRHQANFTIVSLAGP